MSVHLRLVVRHLRQVLRHFFQTRAGKRSPSPYLCLSVSICGFPPHGKADERQFLPRIAEPAPRNLPDDPLARPA